MSEPLLRIDHLIVRFGGLTAVDDVSFTVSPGEIVSLIGPNGAGKTTVFNAITAIHPPSSGEIRFAGRPLCRSLTRAAKLRIAASGLGCGIGTQLAADAQGTWTALMRRYVYQQALAWNDALGDAWGHLVALGPWPFATGAAIGAAAAWQSWRAQRRTPDLAHRRGIARTFQNIRLFREMTALENVLCGMPAHGWYGPIAAALRLPRLHAREAAGCARGRELLEFVGLAGIAAESASSLPYGNQRRLEIARALAGEPNLVLLDEPAAGMNPSESAALIALIRAIRSRGTTVLLIEHDMSVVMGISDRIVVLDHGQLIAQGAPADVRRDPKVIEAYLGKEPA